MMNSQVRTKRCLHVFIFNFFASLILFSSNSVWALTGEEARRLGQGMISHSTNIEGISKANLDAYRQIKDYDTRSNPGISAMKNLDAITIQAMGEVNLGNINLLEATNTLLNYSASIETFKAMKKGAVVVNEIENQLQDKLRRGKDYSVDLSVYADQHKEATNQNPNLLDFMIRDTKSIARASVTGWKIFRVYFDEDKLTGKKVGAAIAVTKAIDINPAIKHIAYHAA